MLNEFKWIVLDNLRVVAWMWLVCICVGESCKSGLMLLHFSNKKSPVPEDATALFGPPLETAFDEQKTSEGTVYDYILIP